MPEDGPGGTPAPRAVRARIATRGADVVLVTVRELRLVLGLLLILFVTAETWRYVGRLAVLRIAVAVVVSVLAALLVVGLGLRHALGPSAGRRATVRVALEVLSFGAALFTAFAVVGIVSVDAGLVAEWSGDRNGVLLSLGIGDPPMVVTRQLLQVSAFLAALGALAFAVEVIADADTRNTLVRDLIEGDPDGSLDVPGR
jgi:hypothetical protein